MQIRITTPRPAVFCAFALLLAPALAEAAAAPDNLIVNGGFEEDTRGWSPLWARDRDAATGTLDADCRREQARAYRVEHRGEKDWSLAQERAVPVHPGEILEMTAWLRARGTGGAAISVVTRDAIGATLDWSHGARTTTPSDDWQLLSSRFVVPDRAAEILPRVTGHGPATVWVDGVTLTRRGALDEMRKADLPATLTLRNDVLEASLQTADGRFKVTDLRTRRIWSQQAGDGPVIVLRAQTTAGGTGLDLTLLDPSSMCELQAAARLEADELVVSLRGKGPMRQPFAWPAPFATAKGQTLILPVNEGISYPADDATLPPMFYHLYGGHGLCMPWYGVTEEQRGWMAIVETPDDAAVRIPRRDGLLRLAPEWQAQRGDFGPERIIRYGFLNRGGYVAMAKRYRTFAKRTGLFRTLEDKRRANPNVDRLVGAVNIWCWDRDAVSWCRELKEAGIDRILWSNALAPDQIKALNDSGVLTSRYDIFQDAMDPANFPKLRYIHGDWTSDAWANDDLLVNADGARARGWEVETKDGGKIPCGVLCDRQAVAYAQRRIPAELATHPYACRFIDTTTASPWRECFHPRHPMTRSESRRFKMDLLEVVSAGCGLVCGSETGHDAAVPYVHYFEGMMSLGPYRVPDAGRDIQRIWEEVPEQVARFQTGHAYRLPLWELVYHDCVVAQWYWGDYNNKLPSLWDRRDLWNALYGTPPMFMFNRAVWTANRDRFVRSYRATAPVARATGYSEMLSHEWLTPDHAVQRTRFADGTAVTVNFGDVPFPLPDGGVLPAAGRRVEN